VVSIMAIAPNFGVFPFGTHVYREPYQDQEELFADLPLLQRLGFNMIKIQESWSVDEPREGEYDFERIERLIRHAAGLGLGIYLGLTMEQAPAWLWTKHPDCRMVYANGLPHNDPTQYLLPADSKPGPCWDHPEARRAAERFIAECARRLGRFDNLWVWNTWQEIGFWPNDGGPLGLCYCPHTLAGFREWLRDKYGSLQELNRAWYTGYGTWEEVEPPRRTPTNPPFTDWRHYMDVVYLDRVLHWKTAALRAHDPGQRPIFSHVATPRLGASAEWRWAQVADFFGNSNYPAWFIQHEWDRPVPESSWHETAVREMWNGIMLRADICRSANGPDRAFWGAEFQGGPISNHLHLGRTPTAADIRRWMLCGLASGMTGISFWNHRAERAWYEANGFGLLDPQGNTTERIEEAGRLGRAIIAEGDLFTQGTLAPAEVAILVSEDLYHFSEATGTRALELYTYSVRGHYERLWQLGVPVDFVSEENVSAGDLARYRVAILPMPLVLDEAYVEALATFVDGGGVLISDACPGRYDRHGFCRREQLARGAEKLFGVEHAGLHLVREVDGIHRWSPKPRGWGEILAATTLEGCGRLSATSIPATFYVQTLRPTTADPILRTDTEQIAGTVNLVGAGQAFLLGTFAGLSATAHPEATGNDVFGQLLFECIGLEPERCGQLLWRRRTLGSREAWFLINPFSHSVRERIQLESGTRARDLVGDQAVVTDDGWLEVEVEPAAVVCVVLDRPAAGAR
jgi:beta-galactosidase